MSLYSKCYFYRGYNFSKNNDLKKIPMLIKQCVSFSKKNQLNYKYFKNIFIESISTIIKIICSMSNTDIDLYINQHINEIIEIKNIIQNEYINCSIDYISQLLNNANYYDWNDGLKLNYTLDSIKYFLTKIGIN